MTHLKYVEDAKKLEQRRISLGYTVKRFAYLCDISPAMLNYFENGNLVHERSYKRYYKIINDKLQELEKAEITKFKAQAGYR